MSQIDEDEWTPTESDSTFTQRRERTTTSSSSNRSSTLFSGPVLPLRRPLSLMDSMPTSNNHSNPKTQSSTSKPQSSEPFPRSVTLDSSPYNLPSNATTQARELHHNQQRNRPASTLEFGIRGRLRNTSNPSTYSGNHVTFNSDLEGNGGASQNHSGWASGSGSGASAFSGLEGRSYRFQPIQDIGSPHSNSHGIPPILSQSYTASSNTIRDSTARLASMALLSDEEGSTGGSGFERINEESPEDSPGSKKLSPSSFTNHKGLSNLSMAMNASAENSRGTSPDESKTVKGIEATESTPLLGLQNVPTPHPQGLVQSPAPFTREGQEFPNLEILSSSAVERDQQQLLRGRQSGRSNISFREPQLPKDRSGSTEMSGSGTSRRTASSSRSRERGSRLSVGKSGDESGISLSPSERERDEFDRSRGNTNQSRNSFGYGALAQAQYAIDYKDKGKSKADPDASGFSLPPDHDEQEEDEDEESRPLLGRITSKLNPSNKIKALSSSIKKLTFSDVVEAGKEPIRLLPAVILGSLLNILDGVSYGMIMFPSAYPIFSNFGGDGVSAFFVTCVLSQLVYSTMSIFKGGNGSMMIEVVPFFHILVNIIIDEIGDENPKAVIATVMVAFALSSILTGIAFLLMGLLRLGVLIGYFPRHILVGCIGGVGIFLIETGLEVCSRLKSEDGFQYNLETLKYFFQSSHMVSLWLPPLLLAILLRFITARFHHPLVFPGYFLAIPVLFYLIAVVGLRMPLDDLRQSGWLFDIGKEAGQAPFYRFYTYFDFSQTSIKALWATMPTQLALVFFGVLHVPLNVPALGISIGEDNVNTDRELVAHGISNILAGLIGTVPNYLCYVNSVLFYRVGGGSALSGFMLAGATFGIMLAGPGTISFLPVMIVGALIFVLGIDLAKEALWDTVGRVNRWEYMTIWIIVVVMTYWDFVIGILAGIIFACLFFVVQTSRRKTVRAIFDGSVARSTVRRHMTQRQFLDAVGTQTQIMKLQGFLFFGTINSVEILVRKALDISDWERKPIRFLIVDFSLVSGVDFSAAEAFTRVQRLLATKDVVLVFCGLASDGDVAISLQSVGMWADCGIRLEVFAHLNEALEWTENEYLRGMYSSGSTAAKAFGQASLAAGGGLDVPDVKRQPAFNISESFENSPRRHHLHEAALTAVNNTNASLASITEHVRSDTEQDVKSSDSKNSPQNLMTKLIDQDKEKHQNQQTSYQPRPSMVQPLPLLMITFKAYATPDMNEHFFNKLTTYFKSVTLTKGQVLWERGDEPDGLYLIESGMLKARYEFQLEAYEINEAMLAGTIAGELSFLSRQARNTTVHAAMDSQLWKLDADALRALENDSPSDFGAFTKMLLRASGEEQDCLMSYLVSRLS